MYYYQSDWETVVLMNAENYEFFCTFGPLVTKEKVAAACEHLLHWIKTHESTYFIMNSPVY
jgi:Third Longin domain of FUZ, MON1 and HPS1